MTENVEGIPRGIGRYRETVATTLREYVQNRDGKLHDMIRYHLGFDAGDGGGELKGKAIRSSLALFITDALDGDPDEVLPAAVSLELVHNFSLVHDDIQDDAGKRRGRASVQKKWNPDQAINAGDGLKDLSTLALTEIGNGSRPAKDLAALDALGNYSLRMIQGQVRDLYFAEREEADVEGYLGMIEDKTCALLEAPFHLGAIYSDVDTADRLISFGKLLGYVYQIRDDWLGIWGEPEKSGKSAESDLVEKKMSFPVVYAVQNGEGRPLERLKNLYFRNDALVDTEIEEVRLALEEAGAKRETNERAKKYWEKAKVELENIGLPSTAKSDMEDFGSFLLNRKK
jgi:geranylgeranyl diphosphate synthase type I